MENPIFGAEISVDKPRDIPTLTLVLHILILCSPDPGHLLQEQDMALCWVRGDWCPQRCVGARSAQPQLQPRAAPAPSGFCRSYLVCATAVSEPAPLCVGIVFRNTGEKLRGKTLYIFTQTYVCKARMFIHIQLCLSASLPYS